MTKYYLAIDIGASSGRHIVGWEENGQIKTDEVYRFSNGVKRSGGHITWSINKLFQEVKSGIKMALFSYPDIRSLAIDTWGCDYVLMNGDKSIPPCYAYRDGRTKNAIYGMDELISFSELYKRTGIQFQPFNTVYQLLDDKWNGRLEDATDFLMIPEYLNYMLTGVKKKEYTNATTTGLINAYSCDWDSETTSAAGLHARLFPELHRPGTSVGMLKPDIAKEVGGRLNVVLCASHDTASAVEGVPMTDNDLYLSSGTWSLLGAKLEKPITDDVSRSNNFTNEGGVGYIRYLKNIMGMWVVNELKRELCPKAAFDEIINSARESKYKKTVDVNAEAFLAPKSMKDVFSARAEPQTVGDHFNCAFRSLAESYAHTIKEIETNTGRTYDKLYIVGGGARNSYLNELTEEFSGKKVVALPIEATAIGNLKIQMEADR